MSDSLPTFTYVLTQLRDRHPSLAYVHFIEADHGNTDDNDPYRETWGPRPCISASHNLETANRSAEKGDIVAFGRWFIANVRVYYLAEGGILNMRYLV